MTQWPPTPQITCRYIFLNRDSLKKSFFVSLIVLYFNSESASTINNLLCVRYSTKGQTHIKKFFGSLIVSYINPEVLFTVIINSGFSIPLIKSVIQQTMSSMVVVALIPPTTQVQPLVSPLTLQRELHPPLKRELTPW